MSYRFSVPFQSGSGNPGGPSAPSDSRNREMFMKKPSRWLSDKRWSILTLPLSCGESTVPELLIQLLRT